MLILLSPAKTMQVYPHPPIEMTTPLFQKEADRIAFEMSGKGLTTLAKELKTTPSIASKALKSYQDFLDPETPASPAIYAYNGIVFKHLSPETLPSNGQTAMCKQVRICSFLYGLLRPADAIKSYRLEGDVRLDLTEGSTLFEFWRSQLTEQLINDTQDLGGTLLFLGSEEMKRLFDWKKVCREVRVVQPLFKVHKGDKIKQIVVYTKMMRGQICRHALMSQMTGEEQELHDFAAIAGAQKVIADKDGMTYTLIF